MYYKSIGSFLIKTKQITEQKKHKYSFFDEQTYSCLEKRNNKLPKRYFHEKHKCPRDATAKCRKK